MNFYDENIFQGKGDTWLVQMLLIESGLYGYKNVIWREMDEALKVINDTVKWSVKTEQHRICNLNLLSVKRYHFAVGIFIFRLLLMMCQFMKVNIVTYLIAGNKKLYNLFIWILHFWSNWLLCSDLTLNHHVWLSLSCDQNHPVTLQHHLCDGNELGPDSI